MVLHVLKFCLSAIFVISVFESHAQHESIFDGPIKPGSKQRYSVNEYLEGSYEKKPTDCNSEYGFFYFRVTKKLSIDSIYVEGQLTKETEQAITRNIYKSRQYWNFINLSNKEAIWIVFPYFQLGGAGPESKDCSNEQRIRQKLLISFAEITGTLRLKVRDSSVIVLTPSKKGGPYIDM